MTNKQLTKLWDAFTNKAKDYGYNFYSYNEVNMGMGTTTYKKDSFVPIIKLKITKGIVRNKEVIIPTELVIFVEDRNGNNVLNGPFCACYKIGECTKKYNSETSSFEITYTENFEEKFLEMCDFAFEKWSVYSRNNRLEYKFNNLKEDRINWN